MKWLLLLLVSNSGFAAISESGTYMMPMNCNELLPDNGPYVQFFDAVAHGQVALDKSLSKRLFRISSLREKVGDAAERSREQNPVDLVIRKSICFYREQKEPLQPIAFDNPGFVKFLKGALKDLENKVDDMVFQAEFERYQRREFERKVNKNKAMIEVLKKEADRDAERAFNKISSAAKKKIQEQD